MDLKGLHVVFSGFENETLKNIIESRGGFVRKKKTDKTTILIYMEYAYNYVYLRDTTLIKVPLYKFQEMYDIDLDEYGTLKCHEDYDGEPMYMLRNDVNSIMKHRIKTYRYTWNIWYDIQTEDYVFGAYTKHDNGYNFYGFKIIWRPYLDVGEPFLILEDLLKIPSDYDLNAFVKYRKKLYRLIPSEEIYTLFPDLNDRDIRYIKRHHKRM